MDIIIDKNINLYTYILTSHNAIYYNFINTNETLNIKNIINNTSINITESYIDKIFPPLNPIHNCFNGLFLLCKKNNNNLIMNTQLPFTYGNNKFYYDINSKHICVDNKPKSTDRLTILKKYNDIIKYPTDFISIINILFNKNITKNNFERFYVNFYEQNIEKINDLYNKYLEYTDLNNILNYIITKHHIINIDIDIDILNFQYKYYRKYVGIISVIADDYKFPQNIKYTIYNSLDDFFQNRQDDKKYKIVKNDNYVLVQNFSNDIEKNIENMFIMADNLFTEKIIKTSLIHVNLIHVNMIQVNMIHMNMMNTYMIMY